MHSRLLPTSFKVALRWVGAIAILGTSLFPCRSPAQNAPMLSGGTGFFSHTSGGKHTYQMIASPLIAAQAGSHLLLEGRGNLVETLSPARTGGYNTSRFFGLSYMQADVIAGRHVTLVGGYFITPFGTYNERLTPIWIANFQDIPLIYGIGTMDTGSSLGGMIRGNVISTSEVAISYAAYVSAGSTNVQVKAQRATGAQTNIYLTKARLEVGASFGRRLETLHESSFGAHVWWQPLKVPISIRSEYAHAPNSQGYWIEADYHVPQYRKDRWLGRLEPIVRLQQAFRNAPDKTDGLPPVDTQEVDFGLNYHLPHEVRINTSYSRQFSSTGNINIWQAGMVYRFLTPVWKGK